MVSLSDGPAGALAARIMALGDRDMEAEAVAELAPAPTDTVLVVGFGPGWGSGCCCPVTITHDWALRKHAASVEEWIETVSAALERAGFEERRSWTGTPGSGGTASPVARRGTQR